jgi:hypothetical protein
LALILLCFVFHCFTLLLHVASLTLRLVAAYSIFHALLCYCLLFPSCFTLILLDVSLMLHLTTTYSLMLHLLLHAHSYFACCYLFLPLHFALLLFTPFFVFRLIATCSLLHISPCYLSTPSFMFHPTTTCSFLHASPYCYLLFPLCFTLWLPVFSFVFHFVTYLLLRTSWCCFCHECQCYEVQSFKCSSMIYIINLYLTFNLISLYS